MGKVKTSIINSELCGVTTGPRLPGTAVRTAPARRGQGVSGLPPTSARLPSTLQALPSATLSTAWPGHRCPLQAVWCAWGVGEVWAEL